MRETLREVPVGEGLIYAGDSEEKAARVTAAAVKCTASRGIGFILMRAPDAVADPDVLAQYVAAIAWHMRCADVAANKVRALEHRLSPLDLLDMLPLPSVITDAAGRAIERNQAFGAFMDAAALRLAMGRLKFDDPFLQDSWQVALSEVDVTAVRQSLLVPAVDGNHWRVHLVPMRCALDADATAARQMIIVIVEQQAPAAGLPQDLLGGESALPLTPAEHQVLDAVLQGHSAKVIATARGASVNTVRSQIMAILDKTGHHNQKSLIAAFAPSSFRQSTSSVSTPLPVTGRRIPPR
jgi:DNA-binding CsgD family transcriptional regulator